MKHVRKSVLLGYAPREIYDIVTDVARYPQFLPWCSEAEVLEQHPDGVTARVAMAYLGLRHAFTTRNHHVPGEQVTMYLVNGPFSSLRGSWHFRPLGDPNAAPAGCKVEFDLRYAFSSRALATVIAPVFDRIADTLVDSFVKRAETVHGRR